MNLSKSKIFLLCCISFIVGIALCRFIPSSLYQYKIYFFAASLVCSIILILFWQNKNFRLISLSGLFLFLGVWRFLISLPLYAPEKIHYYNGQSAVVYGLIADEPDLRQAGQKITINAKYLNLASEGKHDVNNIIPVSGRVLVNIDLYPVYNIGDRLKIKCRLTAPEAFNNFAYDKYLARYGVYSICNFAEITLIEDYENESRFIDESFSEKLKINIISRIFIFKNWLRGIIGRGLVEPEAGLARAILFGDKSGLSLYWQSIYSQTGVSHIMAVSGMNITIMAAFALYFMLFLGLRRQQAFYLSVLLLIFFIIMVGAPASAVRAGIMGILLLWAIHVGRLNKVINSIVMTAAIMLIFNPKLFWDDIGFQLSFLAVLGLIYGHPIIKNFFVKISHNRLESLIDIFSMTIAAQIFTMPVIVYDFYTLSLIAPLANLFIIWLIPLLMATLALGMLFAIFFTGYSVVFFFPSLLFLKYINFICLKLANLPYAYIQINYFNPIWIIFYYLLLILWLKKIYKK